MRAPHTLRFSSPFATPHVAPSVCAPASRARRVLRGVGTAAVVLIGALALVLGALRVFGFTPFVVLSGSMEPTYPVGSLIYVQPVAASELQPGDPVTFVADEQGTVATHRVIGVDDEANLLFTQGDANDVPDGAPVSFANVIGRPFVCVPGAGYAAAWAAQPPGSVVVVVVLVVLVAWAFLPRASSQRGRGRHACR